jgi:hypothetical protein
VLKGQARVSSALVGQVETAIDALVPVLIARGSGEIPPPTS